MHRTSESYSKAIYDPIRENRARVTFDLIDTTVIQDNKTITSSEEFILSNKEQLNNSIREASYNIITCENNRVRLDGSFTFADDTISNNGEVGWIGDVLSNENGVFEERQIITYLFEEIHTIVGLTITFDTINNEYATEFEIKAYDINDDLVSNILVTENTKVQLEKIVKLIDFKKIEIVINKWSKGVRRARVSEIDWGIIRIYEDDKIIKCNFIEEIDILSSKISSNEFKFTIDNSDKLFNILNPLGFYKFLQEKQKIKAEIGTVLESGNVEYVTIGNFLLKTWESDEGSLTATFTCNTRLDLMSFYDFENTESKSNYSLFNLIEELFTICSIKDYEIDFNLKNIYTKCLVEKSTCKDVLQMALIAGTSNIFISKDNKIIIKQDLRNRVDSSINLENMYQIPKVELEDVIKTVEVSYFNTLEDKLTVVLEDKELKLGGNIKVENNTLIDTNDRAIEVAKWIINKSKLRTKYSLNWRGNPALELLDYIDIENNYNEEIKAYITKTELEYQGYLKGKTELIGGIK